MNLGQPQARTLADRFSGKKRLESSLQYLLRDTGARIPDFDADRFLPVEFAI